MADLPVPKVLHQIWLTGDPPPDAAAWIAGVRKAAAANGWAYEWWTRARLLAELPEFAERERLAPTVQYQADIARWLLLRDLGGLYLDCDIELWYLPRDLSGAWIQGCGGIALNGAAIAAPLGHRYMRAILDLAGRAGSGWKPLCGGNYFQGEALGPDVHLWAPWQWLYRGWGRERGFGFHHGRFRLWNSYRPREE